MCLQRVFTKSEREKVLAKLPEEFIVWKVLNDYGVIGWRLDGCRYTTDCRSMPIHAGEMKFKTNTIGRTSTDKEYRGGGHFWLHKEAAEKWKCDDNERIVRCRVKKKWITNVGVQDIGMKNGGVVVVAKKAIFPKYIGQMDVKNN